MKRYQLISGRKARKEGLYQNREFILDKKNAEAYDAGIWLLEGGQHYARWFDDLEFLIRWVEENYQKPRGLTC